MTSDQMHSHKEATRRPGSVNFGLWTIVVFGGHAVGITIFVGFLGLAMNIPARKLLVPYTTLLFCGLVLSPLLYWARLSRERPNSCALRFGIAMFLYLQVLMVALAFGTISLGILSQNAAINDYAPFIVPFSALVCVVLYFVTRQILRSTQSR